ncbi:MAG: matrixin family metalloprotease [Myxococcota bacterium]
MRPLGAVLTILVALGLSHASTAEAFVREVVDTNPSQPLFWQNRTIELRVAGATSADLTAPQVVEAVRDSANTWSDPGCTDVQVVVGPPPAGQDTSLTTGTGDGENRIIWREDEWPADPEALAITTLVYSRSTGQILDADIDVNGVDYGWTADGAPLVINDAQNTLTHEIGHLLGFAHAPDPTATMFGASGPGDVQKRDLAVDDENGVCEVYPAGLPTPQGGGRGGGLEGTCSAAGPATLWPLLVAFLLLGRSVRRRRER